MHQAPTFTSQGFVISQNFVLLGIKISCNDKDAIIHFGTEQHKSIFAPSEAADIKSVMQEYGEKTE